MIDHNTPIEVGDEVVLQIAPGRRHVVTVTKVAGLGLWAADNGMYFQRKQTVEMFKKRDATRDGFSWVHVLRNTIILAAALAVAAGFYYNGVGL
jgi:hypothetical protein